MRGVGRVLLAHARGSYYHGTIAREEAVARLEKANRDGTFLLRMSSTQDKAYTISVQVLGEIKHIRVNNEYVLHVPRVLTHRRRQGQRPVQPRQEQGWGVCLCGVR